MRSARAQANPPSPHEPCEAPAPPPPPKWSLQSRPSVVCRPSGVAGRGCRRMGGAVGGARGAPHPGAACLGRCCGAQAPQPSAPASSAWPGFAWAAAHSAAAATQAGESCSGSRPRVRARRRNASAASIRATQTRSQPTIAHQQVCARPGSQDPVGEPWLWPASSTALGQGCALVAASRISTTGPAAREWGRAVDGGLAASQVRKARGTLRAGRHVAVSPRLQTRPRASGLARGPRRRHPA